MRDRVSLLIPSVVFAIIFVLYFGALAFSPVLLFLSIDALRKKRIALAMGSFVATIATTALLLRVCGYAPASFLERFTGGQGHILPVFEHRNEWQGYSMFSSAHLLELANLHLLLSPFALILLLHLVFKSMRLLDWKSRDLLFILLNAACGLGMMTIFLSDLGISRDWDLLSVFGLGTVIAAAYLLQRSPLDPGVRRRVFFVITTITFLHTTGFVLVNASENRSLPRSELFRYNDYWGRKIHVIYEQVAMYYRDHGDYQAAIKNYLKFLEKDSTNVRILGNLADVYHTIGNVDSERICLERTIRGNPTNKNVYVNLAKLYVKQQRYDEANELMLKGFTTDISSPDTLTDLGLYSIKLRQDYREALQYFNRAIALDSSYAEAYLNAGISYHELNEFVKMSECFRKFLQLRPDYPQSERLRQLINGIK